MPCKFTVFARTLSATSFANAGRTAGTAFGKSLKPTRPCASMTIFFTICFVFTSSLAHCNAFIITYRTFLHFNASFSFAPSRKLFIKYSRVSLSSNTSLAHSSSFTHNRIKHLHASFKWFSSLVSKHVVVVIINVSLTSRTCDIRGPSFFIAFNSVSNVCRRSSRRSPFFFFSIVSFSKTLSAQNSFSHFYVDAAFQTNDKATFIITLLLLPFSSLDSSSRKTNPTTSLVVSRRRTVLATLFLS